MGAGEHMAGLPQPDELLEFPGNKLRAVVADDARTGRRILLARFLQHELRVSLFHCLANVRLHDKPACSLATSLRLVFDTVALHQRKCALPLFANSSFRRSRRTLSHTPVMKKRLISLARILALNWQAPNPGAEIRRFKNRANIADRGNHETHEPHE